MAGGGVLPSPTGGANPWGMATNWRPQHSVYSDIMRYNLGHQQMNANTAMGHANNEAAFQRALLDPNLANAINTGGTNYTSLIGAAAQANNLGYQPTMVMPSKMDTEMARQAEIATQAAQAAAAQQALYAGSTVEDPTMARENLTPQDPTQALHMQAAKTPPKGTGGPQLEGGMMVGADGQWYRTPGMKIKGDVGPTMGYLNNLPQQPTSVNPQPEPAPVPTEAPPPQQAPPPPVEGMTAIDAAQQLGGQLMQDPTTGQKYILLP